MKNVGCSLIYKDHFITEYCNPATRNKHVIFKRWKKWAKIEGFRTNRSFQGPQAYAVRYSTIISTASSASGAGNLPSLGSSQVRRRVSVDQCVWQSERCRCLGSSCNHETEVGGPCGLWDAHCRLSCKIRGLCGSSPSILNTSRTTSTATRRHTHETWIFLTLNPLTWKIWWAPNNASRWQMGFNSACKGLNTTTRT